jgi:DNA gyrase subunit A
MTAGGVVLRTKVSEISTRGRGTRGVKVMRPEENDRLVGVVVVPPDVESGEVIPEETKNELNLNSKIF